MLKKLIVPSSYREHGRPWLLTPTHSPYVEHAVVVLVARHRNSATAPVQFVHHIQVLVADQQRAQTRREAEHLVEGHGHEVRLVERQVQAVRRHEGCRVQQHQPLVSIVEVIFLYLLNPAQRVLHAGEVVLCGEREQAVGVVLLCLPVHLLQVALALERACLVIGQILLIQHVEAVAEAVCVLADAQNRVVVLRWREIGTHTSAR